MTNQEILTKAIDKAVERGYRGQSLFYRDALRLHGDSITVGPDSDIHINEVIFSHDFAKALWGEPVDKSATMTQTEMNKATGGTFNAPPGMFAIYSKGWKDHLQEMVIADDPIAYLGEHL